MAFVRLSEARDMGEVVSVPLPVRFIFILLGPEDVTMDYHEIGRAISTLMSNHDFHNRYFAPTKIYAKFLEPYFARRSAVPLSTLNI